MVGSKQSKDDAKTGRPRRSAEEGILSRSLTFRVRPPLYKQIQEAAEREKRSLSEEIEARILTSFRQEVLEKERFGKPDVAFLANLIAAAVSLEQERYGRSFLDDEDTYTHIYHVITDAYETLAKEYRSRKVTIEEGRRRFDQLDYKRIKDGPIDDAEFASVPLDEVMGR